MIRNRDTINRTKSNQLKKKAKQKKQHTFPVQIQVPVLPYDTSIYAIYQFIPSIKLSNYQNLIFFRKQILGKCVVDLKRAGLPFINQRKWQI